jgi:hypothetical protein
MQTCIAAMQACIAAEQAFKSFPRLAITVIQLSRVEIPQGMHRVAF